MQPLRLSRPRPISLPNSKPPAGGSLGSQGDKQSFETLASQLEAGSDDARQSLGLPISRADVALLLRKLGSVVTAPPAAGPTTLNGGKVSGGPGCEVSTSTGPLASSPAAAASGAGVGMGPLPPQVGGSSVSSSSVAAVGSSGGVVPIATDIDDDKLLDEYMGILEAHHSLDEHCDVDQQRQLAARLVTMATGGKRRLVQQPQDSD